MHCIAYTYSIVLGAYQRWRSFEHNSSLYLIFKWYPTDCIARIDRICFNLKVLIVYGIIFHHLKWWNQLSTHSIHSAIENYLWYMYYLCIWDDIWYLATDASAVQVWYFSFSFGIVLSIVVVYSSICLWLCLCDMTESESEFRIGKFPHLAPGLPDA